MKDAQKRKVKPDQMPPDTLEFEEPIAPLLKGRRLQVPEAGNDLRAHELHRAQDLAVVLAAQALRAVAAINELKSVKLTGNKGLLESLDKAEADYAGALQASGGVRDLDDVLQSRAQGCAGVVLGRSLLEGRLQLSQALAAVGAR